MCSRKGGGVSGESVTIQGSKKPAADSPARRAPVFPPCYEAAGAAGLCRASDSSRGSSPFLYSVGE